MSTDAVTDAALQKRVSLTFVLFMLLSFLNTGINYAFHRARSAENAATAQQDERDNEMVAEGNAKIDSRIAEAKSIVAENTQLQQQAKELNEKAAKIESALKGSTSKGK